MVVSSRQQHNVDEACRKLQNEGLDVFGMVCHVGKHDDRQNLVNKVVIANQWRSQPDNLVPLCKFEIIIIIHFFRNRLFSQSKITKICIAGLNRRAGYATVANY